MRLNPEIQRYAWLELSLQRLIAMPLVLCVIFYIAAQSHHVEESIIYVSFLLLTLLLGIWGGHKAATSVLDEVNNNTWDFQRLSSLSPMSLTFGKIFGSTLYCWYGALMVLSVYIISSAGLIPAYYLFCNVVTIICSALICHSSALLASLQSMQVKIPGRSKIQSIGAHMIGIVLGSFFIFRIRSVGYDNITNIHWYGQEYDVNEFTAFFSVIAVLWITGGVYWMMRNQLRMRTGPWFWMSFVIFMMFFISGFNNKFYYGETISRLLNSYWVGMLLLYCMVLIEPWSSLLYRRLLDSWKAKNIKNFMNLFPRWFATFILVFFLVLLSSFNLYGNKVVLFTTLASFCFAIRDIALLHYCKLLPNARRSQAAALFYLFVLYGLIPALLLSLRSREAISLFWLIPMPELVVNSFISALMQAMLFSALAFHRWNKYWR